MHILPAAAHVAKALDRDSDRDCCVFARLVLRQSYGALSIDAVPAWRWHMVVERGAGAWEPVIAARDAGIVEGYTVPRDPSLPPSPPPTGRWALVQGWRGVALAPGVTGHTFLYRSLTDETGVVVDSTRGRGPRAGGFARWAELVREYRGGLAVAVLRPPG